MKKMKHPTKNDYHSDIKLKDNKEIRIVTQDDIQVDVEKPKIVSYEDALKIARKVLEEMYGEN
jgi:hypothetical protein